MVATTCRICSRGLRALSSNSSTALSSRGFSTPRASVPSLQRALRRDLQYGGATRLPASENFVRRFHASLRSGEQQIPGDNPLKDSATSQAERSMRRFWKEVSLAKASEAAAKKGGKLEDGDEDHLVVQLDARSLKTPSGSPLRIPLERPLLGALIAQEWDEQETVLRPHALPLTSIVSRALDGLGTESQRQAVAADLQRYLETDTICFQETQPPALVRLQKEHWDPLFAWVEKRFGAKIQPYEGLMLGGQGQDATAKKILGEHVAAFDAWKLAAFERATLVSKSYLIALALVEGHLDVEQAAAAAEVEVRSQIERWGEVEDTHDVDYHDLRKTLASAAIVLVEESSKAEVANALV